MKSYYIPQNLEEKFEKYFSLKEGSVKNGLYSQLSELNLSGKEFIQAIEPYIKKINNLSENEELIKENEKQQNKLESIINSFESIAKSLKK